MVQNETRNLKKGALLRVRAGGGIGWIGLSSSAEDPLAGARDIDANDIVIFTGDKNTEPNEPGCIGRQFLNVIVPVYGALWVNIEFLERF